MQQRLDWVDIIKGIGILCVVFGHTLWFTTPFVFLFHMPLFFFVGGYLFRPAPDNKAFLIKKARHLLVPYLGYFALITLLLGLAGERETFGESVVKVLFGGRYLALSGRGPLWFITCFFLTQQLFNLLIKNNRIASDPLLRWGILVVLPLTGAYLNQYFFQEVRFPWAINVVLYALPNFYAGYLYRNGVEAKEGRPWGIGLLAAVLLGCSYRFPSLAVDMYYAHYGWPVVSFLAGLAVILALIRLSKAISRWGGFAAGLLRAFGQASLVVLALHMMLWHLLRDHFPVVMDSVLYRALAVLICCFVPLGAYYLFGCFGWTRRLFLGTK